MFPCELNKRYRAALILWILLTGFNAVAQIPQYIKRYSPPNSSTFVKDSATNSIILNPGFQWLAVANSSYLGIVIKPEVNIEWPKSGQIVQRSNTNKAWVRIKGVCDSLIDSVKVDAISISGGTNKSKNIKVNGGIFETALELFGGDYNISVVELYTNNAYANSTSARSSSVSRIGVGEIILAWGHSFMTGTIGVNANDPRSRTITTVFQNPDYPDNNFFQNINDLPVEFKHLDEDQVGPFATKSWILSGLADTLVNRLQVPVLIYSSAFGGSNIFQNLKNIENEPFGYTWFGGGVWQNNGFPFRAVEATFEKYIPITGLRGVITAHGVNDNSILYGDPTNFAANLNSVINHIRTVEANNAPNLAFMLGLEDSQFADINNQLLSVINNDPNIFMGIDLRNTATHGSWRDDSYGINRGHYIGMLGLQKYLELWADAIQSSFFTNTTPILPVVDPNLTN